MQVWQASRVVKLMLTYPLTIATALEIAVCTALLIILTIWTAARARVNTAAVAVATERWMEVAVEEAEPIPAVSQLHILIGYSKSAFTLCASAFTLCAST